MAALARLPALRALVLDNCEQLGDAGAAPGALWGCCVPPHARLRTAHNLGSVLVAEDVLSDKYGRLA